MDVRKAANLFKQVKVPIIGVVENMSYYHHTASDEKIYLFGKDGGQRLALENGVPFLGSIPIDPEICRCGDSGRSLFLENDIETPGRIAFLSIAKALVSHTAALQRSCGGALASFELDWKEMS